MLNIQIRSSQLMDRQEFFKDILEVLKTLHAIDHHEIQPYNLFIRIKSKALGYHLIILEPTLEIAQATAKGLRERGIVIEPILIVDANRRYGMVKSEVLESVAKFTAPRRVKKIPSVWEEF